MNPNIPPLVMRGINTVGDAITRRLDQEGKPGAISRHAFDTWWNGGMRTAPYFHNMVGILTETAHPSATPSTYDPATFTRTFDNGIPTLQPTTDYPSPYAGGEWHLRDSCEYILTASIAVLDIAAKRREEWLYDIYQMGRDAIRAGRAETYIVPAEQWDPGAAVRMMNALRWGGVEVERARAPFTAGGRSYSTGSYIVRGGQPFRAHVADLLNPQVYPERRQYPGGPPRRPYDVTGWTLPMQMGVTVDKVAEEVEGSFDAVQFAASSPATIPASAKFAYAVDSRHNDAFTAVNRLLEGGAAVFRSPTAVRVDGTDWPAGTFLVPPEAAARADLEEAARTLGISVGATDDPLAEDAIRLRTPRLGLYHAYGGNIDEGWTRWLLAQYEFPYASLYDKDVRAGGLRNRFDVVVLPDASYDSMVGGQSGGSLPAEYTGGMSPRGIANLQAFVEAGGTLVTLDSAGDLALRAFGLPVRNAAVGQPESNFYIPGSLLRIEVDNRNPVAFGMPGQAAAFFSHSPAYAIGPEGPAEPGAGTGTVPAGVQVAARYPGKGVLLSGWLMGEPVVAGRAAVVTARVGRGRIVLLGFRTQHRGQSHGTFKLLFNSIYLGGSEWGSAGETVLTHVND
jgi:hypothetical protein